MNIYVFSPPLQCFRMPLCVWLSLWMPSCFCCNIRGSFTFALLHYTPPLPPCHVIVQFLDLSNFNMVCPNIFSIFILYEQCHSQIFHFIKFWNNMLFLCLFYILNVVISTVGVFTFLDMYNLILKARVNLCSWCVLTDILALAAGLILLFQFLKTLSFA